MGPQSATRPKKGPSRPVKVEAERLALQMAVPLLNGLYALLKLLPVRHKVVFISWNSDGPSLDFRVLADRLSQLPNPPKVVFLCRELRHGAGQKLVYTFHLLHQMYAFATAETVALDAYCPLASILRHRPSLRVIQLWHAIGAFKKFGWSIVDKSEGWSAQSNIPSRTLSRLMRMHNGYTSAVVSYAGAIPYFAEAFAADPSIFHVAWLPRVELLRDDRWMAGLRQRILAAHPELAGRRVVVYAPTMRRTAIDTWRVDSLVEAVAGSDWAMIVKPHPVRGERQEPVFPGRTVDVADFSAVQLLALADAVITDYSAIVYEAYLRGTPVYFFADDMAEYEQARGFYTHPSQFPSRIYATADELVRDLVAGVGDRGAMERFVDTYLEDSPRRQDILDLFLPAASPKASPVPPNPAMSLASFGPMG